MLNVILKTIKNEKEFFYIFFLLLVMTDQFCQTNTEDALAQSYICLFRTN